VGGTVDKSVMRKVTSETTGNERARVPSARSRVVRRDRETAHAPLRIPLPEQLHRLLHGIPFSDARDVFRERELLIDSFGRLFRRHGSGGDRIRPAPVDRQILARVKDRIHAEYASNLHLEDLAAEVGLTTFQLIGLFKRTVGLTPHAYLTQIRLSMACRRLRHAPALADVAPAVGFYDQSALNKHFKRCYGITPRQFARAAAA